MHRERRPEALADRLRELPPPAVPADLEARLLAGIPAPGRRSRRGWAVGACAVAAACLLVVLAWPRAGHPLRQGDAVLPTGRLAQQTAEEFTWPLDGTEPVGVPTSIPADLFD